MGKWDREGKAATTGCGIEQGATKDNRSLIPLENSGRQYRACAFKPSCPRDKGRVGSCNGLKICGLPPAPIYMLISQPWSDGIISFGMQLGHQNGVLMNGISLLIITTPKSSVVFFPLCEDKTRSWQSATSPEPSDAITLVSDFQAPEQWEMNFCCL